MKLSHHLAAVATAILTSLALPAAATDAAKTATPCPDSIRIAFWNCENLFDTANDPTNPGDDEYSEGGWRHWSHHRYTNKVDHLAAIIAKMDVDIIGLQEVENRAVLDDLNQVLARKYSSGFTHIVHREGPDHRGIDVAVLTNLKPRDAHWITPVPEQRDILLVEFGAQDAPLYVCVNHWKSHFGKKAVSADMRNRQAKALHDKVARLLKEKPRSGIVVGGDFNENFDSHLLTSVLGSTTQKLALVEGRHCDQHLFNLHSSLEESERGTIYYKRDKTWNTFDGISLSCSLLPNTENPHARSDWSLAGKDAYEVVRYPEMLTELGHPKAFRRVTDPTTKKRSFQRGYSDHFPVRVVLQRRDTTMATSERR